MPQDAQPPTSPPAGQPSAIRPPSDPPPPSQGRELSSLGMLRRWRGRDQDQAARFEMMPLIDVVFLLLTFFIYSLVLMVQAEVLPVELAAVGSGQKAQESAIHAVTIDQSGQLYYNREPIEPAALDAKLKALAEDPADPTLYLALEAQAEVDRSPMLVDLLRRVQRAGVENVALVGQPEVR